jgi:hypothetical protein
MVRKYQRAPNARPYKAYTEEALEKAADKVKSGSMSMRKASNEFKIPIGTLCHKCNKKYANAVGHPNVFSKDEEAEFVKYITVVAEWGFPFDYVDLRMLAKTYLSKAGRTVKQFKNNWPSMDWARSFVKRHKEALVTRKCQNIKRARAAVSPHKISTYFSNLEKVLTNEDGSKVPQTHIFSYDEMNLSDDPGTKMCIFKRGVKYPDRVHDSSKTSTSHFLWIRRWHHASCLCCVQV